MGSGVRLRPLSACPECAVSLAAGLRFCGQCGSVLGTRDPTELAEAADPWLGRVVDGRYRVLARLGTGGMGVVYRVEHLHLGKTAAMKVLAPGHRREARDGAAVSPRGAGGQQAQSPEHRPDVRLRPVRRRALPGDGVHQGRRSRVAAAARGAVDASRARRASSCRSARG